MPRNYFYNDWIDSLMCDDAHDLISHLFLHSIIIFTHLNMAPYGWMRYIAIADPIAQSPAASSKKAPVL